MYEYHGIVAQNLYKTEFIQKRLCKTEAVRKLKILGLE